MTFNLHSSRLWHPSYLLITRMFCSCHKVFQMETKAAVLASLAAQHEVWSTEGRGLFVGMCVWRWGYSIPPLCLGDDATFKICKNDQEVLLMKFWVTAPFLPGSVSLVPVFTVIFLSLFWKSLFKTLHPIFSCQNSNSLDVKENEWIDSGIVRSGSYWLWQMQC